MTSARWKLEIKKDDESLDRLNHQKKQLMKNKEGSNKYISQLEKTQSPEQMQK